MTTVSNGGANEAVTSVDQAGSSIPPHARRDRDPRAGATGRVRARARGRRAARAPPRRRALRPAWRRPSGPPVRIFAEASSSGIRSTGRRLQLLPRRRPRLRPASRQQLLGERLERDELLVGLDHRGGRPEHDDRAVVHRVLEHRACEDDPVEQRDGEARGDPARELAERPARRRAVDVDRRRRPGRGAWGSRTAGRPRRSRGGRRARRRGRRRSLRGRTGRARAGGAPWCAARRPDACGVRRSSKPTDGCGTRAPARARRDSA